MNRARDDHDDSPRRRHQSLRRTVVGIISDAPPQATIDADAHIIINEARDGVVGGAGGVGLGREGGVEDGIVSLEPNDDFAMGAPPGAPGAIGLDEGAEDRDLGRGVRAAPDVTPRANTINLPPAPGVGRTGTIPAPGVTAHGTVRATHHHRTRAGLDNVTGAAPIRAALTTTTTTTHHVHHHRDADSGPYRDEDVLLSLQLLAYLSKYPHVRQAFYKPRTTFHPASASMPGPRSGQSPAAQGIAGPSRAAAAAAATVTLREQQQHGFLRAFGASRGKEKEKEKSLVGVAPQPSAPASSSSSSNAATTAHPSAAVRQTNVFSLVERFTFKLSSSEGSLHNAPPQLPPEIQYWAGVIMRNACRKDESQGGIRQCANSE